MLERGLFDIAGVPVKVSAASARLPFTECGPACNEANDCGGRCCDRPGNPAGALVSVAPFEQRRFEALGADVRDGLLVPRPDGKCPFKTADGLCSLHDAGAKPFGCVASPFVLNSAGTLIIRHRFLQMPCYRGKGPKGPAYRVYFSSLVRMFGPGEAARIRAHLDAGGGDMRALMPVTEFEAMLANQASKHAAKARQL